MYNQCNSCNQCNSFYPGQCNTCTSPNVDPCTYDCSPPLWQTWPRIEIRRCDLPSFCGCSCQPECNRHHRVYESEDNTDDYSESYSESSHRRRPCHNQCRIPCQLDPCCDPTIGLCAQGCKKH